MVRERVLDGRYRLLERLGVGGMGEVWKAEHITLRSQVAVKLLDEKIASNADKQARFFREARAAAALASPHVVRVFDFGVAEGAPYIAMELLEGETLALRLRKSRRLSPADTVRIIAQVGRAASAAHELGIIHRDLKPDNIFLVKNDDDELIKVLDFGVAKFTSDTLTESLVTETVAGAMMGTPYYMSPEQVKGTTVDARTDVWAVGVIAYQCLTGQVPFQGDSLGSLVFAICKKIPEPASSIADVPPGFDEWFGRAAARHRSQRFASMKEAVDELRRVCATPAVTTRASIPDDVSDPTHIDARPAFADSAGGADDEEPTRLALLGDSFDDDEATRVAKAVDDDDDDADGATRVVPRDLSKLGDHRMGRAPPQVARGRVVPAAGQSPVGATPPRAKLPPSMPATNSALARTGRSQTWDEESTELGVEASEELRRKALVELTARPKRAVDLAATRRLLWVLIGAALVALLATALLLALLIGRR